MLYYPLNSKTVLGITVTYPPNLANVHHSIMVYLLTLSSIVSNSTTLYLTFLIFVLRFAFILQEITNPSHKLMQMNLPEDLKFQSTINLLGWTSSNWFITRESESTQTILRRDLIRNLVRNWKSNSTSVDCQIWFLFYFDFQFLATFTMAPEISRDQIPNRSISLKIVSNTI